MATDDSQFRRARDPTDFVVRLWAGLDRGWQATVLGIAVVLGSVLVQTV